MLRFTVPPDCVFATALPAGKGTMLTVPRIIAVEVAREVLLSLPVAGAHDWASVDAYLDSLRVPLEWPPSRRTARTAAKSA